MELPIAKESYRGGADALGRAVRRAELTLARTAAEETELDGAVAMCAPGRPGVRMLNYAADLTLPDGADAGHVVGQVLDHFKQRGAPCHTMHGAAAAWPAPLVEALAARGYAPATRLIFLLREYRGPKRINDSLQIVPARAVYPQLDAFFRGMARKEHGADETLTRDLAAAMVDRLDEPRLDLFLARIHGVPVAVAGVLTLGQIGVINAAWSDPDRRGQGIGAAIMAHVLEHCARSALEQIVIDRAEHCTAIPFYESLGFVRVGQFIKYRRLS